MVLTSLYTSGSQKGVILLHRGWFGLSRLEGGAAGTEWAKPDIHNVQGSPPTAQHYEMQGVNGTEAEKIAFNCSDQSQAGNRHTQCHAAVPGQQVAAGRKQDGLYAKRRS